MARSARINIPTVKVMESVRHLLVTGPVRGHPAMILVPWTSSVLVLLNQKHTTKGMMRGYENEDALVP